MRRVASANPTSQSNQCTAIMDLPDLKRDDIARKSIRLPAGRLTAKRLAPPVPPLRVESTLSPGDNNNHTAASNGDHSSGGFLKLSDMPKLEAVSLQRNSQARLDFFAGPSLAKQSSPRPRPQPLQSQTTAAQPPTVASAADNITSIDMLNKLERQINQMELEHKANELFPLSGVGSQPHQHRQHLEQLDNQQPRSLPPIKPMVKVTNRYGDHENLLNTGISNVSSGQALCHTGGDDDDDDDADLRPREFQRATQTRNSTLGVSTARTTPKATKPIGRTVSDTKNVESVVKTIRLGLKKMDEDFRNTVAHRAAAVAAAKTAAIAEAKAAATAAAAAAANGGQSYQYQPHGQQHYGQQQHGQHAGTMSPLTSKKKEDTIIVAEPRVGRPMAQAAASPHQQQPQPQRMRPTMAPLAQIPSHQASTQSASAKQRFADRDTLRHAITSPTASRSRDSSSSRAAQVTHSFARIYCLCIVLWFVTVKISVNTWTGVNISHFISRHYLSDEHVYRLRRLCVLYKYDTLNVGSLLASNPIITNILHFLHWKF